jgi:hypothetical protein
MTVTQFSRKLILGALVAMVLVPGLALGQTAYSVNVVGFQKVELQDQDFAMGGMPFIPGDPDIQEVIGPQLTAKAGAAAADNIWLWDLSGQTYQQLFLKKSAGGIGTDLWVTAVGEAIATNEIYDGSAFFLDENRSLTQTVVVVGDVVEDGVITNVIVPGFNMVAYPFSADAAINDLTFDNGRAKAGAAAADNIWLWDVPAQTYLQFFLKKNAGGTGTDQWVNAVGETFATNVITTGNGFFYESKNTQNVEWVQARPYTLP